MTKKRTTITIDEALLEHARNLGVNVSAAVERTLVHVVRRAELNAEADRQLAEFESAGEVYDEELLEREMRRIQEWESRIAGRAASEEAPTAVVDLMAAVESSLEAARAEPSKPARRAKRAG